MTIFVTSQLIVILDSIRNSCDVLKSIFSLLQLIPYLIIGHCAIVICQLHRNISVFTLLNIQIHTADCKLSHLWMLCETNLDGIFYINQLISQRHRSQNIVVAPLHKKTMILQEFIPHRMRIFFTHMIPISPVWSYTHKLWFLGD